MRRSTLTGSTPKAPLLALTLLWLALVACGGSKTDEITVATEAGPGGSLSPSSRQFASEDIARFTLSTDAGYELERISGCKGSLTGNRYETAPVSANCTVRADFRPIEYNLAATAGPNGTITPVRDTLTVEDRAEFTLTPDPDYRVAQVTGCGGTLKGNTYSISGVTSHCTIAAQFEADVYTLSGTISAAALITLDSTLNDPIATEPLSPHSGDNDSFASARAVNNRASISGFAAAVGTGETCDTGSPERYRDDPNPYDYYRVSLQAGQLLQLQVANFESHDGTCDSDARLPSRPPGELSITLFDQNQNPVAGTLGRGEYQEVIVPESGDYVVQVAAESGISRYVLRLLPEGVPPVTDLRDSFSGAFVTGEMLVKPRAQASATAPTRAAAKAFNDPPTVHRELIVPFQSGSPRNTGSLAAAARPQGSPEAYARLETIKAIKARRKDPSVAYAEPNYIRQPLREPNDPDFHRQWHYQAINLTQAWDITVGEPVEGPPPIVAVLDTGVVRNHPDLRNQLVPGYDFVLDPDRSGDNEPGIDPDPSDPGDGDATKPDSWHGTHVAGTVAAEANNGTGGTGVSWGARIMPIRVLGTGGGTNYDVIQGVRYAAGLENDSGTRPERRADIINLSLGSPDFSQSEAELYARLRDEQGIILVAAAGNAGNNTRYYPAAYPSVLSVGATNALRQRAPYSNFGDTIALVAPGGDLTQDANGDGFADGIFSTSAERRDAKIAARYSLFYQGTSMAAPHVAGVLALMKAAHPELTPDTVDALLLSGALTDREERTDELGYGQIDAYQAVMAVQGPTQSIVDRPRISLTPSRLNLGTTESARVTLANEGGGDPHTVETLISEPWLKVSPSADTDAGTTGLGDYLISVERESLKPGFYEGQATFLFDNSTETRLRVYMQVGDLSSDGELTAQYVLLLNPEPEPGEDEVVLQTVAHPDPNRPDRAHFALEEVPPGRYVLIAGSDIDADGVICQIAEQCGAYPSLEREQIIDVSDADHTNLDFVARILGGFIDSVGLDNPPKQALERSPDDQRPWGRLLDRSDLPSDTDAGAQRPQDF